MIREDYARRMMMGIEVQEKRKVEEKVVWQGESRSLEENKLLGEKVYDPAEWIWIWS